MKVSMNMIDNIDTQRSLLYRTRIFDWQREVAGQPVTSVPSLADMEFCAAQLGFVREELEVELVPHLEAYLAKPLNADELEHKKALADDIGDVAFTLIGLMNARGAKNAWDYGAARTSSIRDLARGLRRASDGGFTYPNSSWGPVFALEALASRLGISFWHALKAVCDSNDTKLWRQSEVDAGVPDGATVTKVVGRARADGSRIYRVKRADGKLLKSPSFEPPNLDEAIGLTDAGPV